MHAKVDADQLITKTDIDLAVSHTTQFIGEDTDVFQFLVSQLCPNSKVFIYDIRKTKCKTFLLRYKNNK